MMSLRQQLYIFTVFKDHPNIFKTVNETQDVTERCAAVWRGLEINKQERREGTELKPKVTTKYLKAEFLVTDMRDQ